MSDQSFHCPIEATVNLIGGKYKVMILWYLIGKILRFNELQKLVSGATPKMLTQQLRELERDGLISRTVYPVVPPKTEYALTELGNSFIPILKLMGEWGMQLGRHKKARSEYSERAADDSGAYAVRPPSRQNKTPG